MSEHYLGADGDDYDEAHHHRRVIIIITIGGDPTREAVVLNILRAAPQLVVCSVARSLIH